MVNAVYPPDALLSSGVADTEDLRKLLGGNDAIAEKQLFLLRTAATGKKSGDAKKIHHQGSHCCIRGKRFTNTNIEVTKKTHTYSYDGANCYVSCISDGFPLIIEFFSYRG